MTFAAILLTVIALILFILTRTTYVYIKYCNVFVLEFHFVIFSLKLRFDENNKRKGGLNPAFYTSLTKRLVNFSRLSEIKLIKLNIASKEKNSFERMFPFSYGFLAIALSFIAYLTTVAKRVTLEENAINIDPSNRVTNLEVRLYTELFNLILLFAKVIVDLIKYSKKRKYSYVGN